MLGRLDILMMNSILYHQCEKVHHSHACINTVLVYNLNNIVVYFEEFETMLWITALMIKRYVSKFNIILTT